MTMEMYKIGLTIHLSAKTYAKAIRIVPAHIPTMTYQQVWISLTDEAKALLDSIID